MAVRWRLRQPGDERCVSVALTSFEASDSAAGECGIAPRRSPRPLSPPPQVDAGTPVAIYAENKEHALAIGYTTLSTADVRVGRVCSRARHAKWGGGPGARGNGEGSGGHLRLVTRRRRGARSRRSRSMLLPGVKECSDAPVARHAVALSRVRAPR